MKAWARAGILLALCGVLAQAQDGAAVELLSRGRAAMGGAALEQIGTYLEDYSLVGSVAGVRLGEIRIRVYIDLKGKRRRWEFLQGDKVTNVAQITPQGGYTWSEKEGTKPLREGREPTFSYTTPFKAGLMALLAASRGEGKLEARPNGELFGLRGSLVTVREGDTSYSFLLGPDGTLLADRVNSKDERNNTLDAGIVYSEYRVVKGVRVPVAGSVRGSTVPPLVSAQFRVNRVEINPVFDGSEFKLP